MLRIADYRPELIGEAMKAVMQLVMDNKIPKPSGQSFNISELATAHHLLESRKTIWKLAVLWK